MDERVDRGAHRLGAREVREVRATEPPRGSQQAALDRA
jgi:hypothetical protein